MSESKQRWLPGWKVVYVGCRDGLLSCTGHRRGRSVVYVEGDVTYPRKDCGPLAVFKTLEKANDFWAKHFSSWSLYGVRQCAYVRGKHRAVWDSVCRIDLNRLPAGTDTADAVMLWPQDKDSQP